MPAMKAARSSAPFWEPFLRISKLVRPMLLASLLQIAFAVTAIKPAVSDSANITKQYCDVSEDYCAGFVQAAIEIANSSSETKIICLPKGTDYGNLIDQFLDFFQRNQDKKFRPALEFVTLALKERFACFQ